MSDKITTKAVIKYKAIDDIGRKWLNEIINTSYSVEIYPVIEDDAAVCGGSSAEPFIELTEYSTEDEKYFYVGNYMSGDDYSTDLVNIRYSLYSRFENNTQINIAESVQYTDYELDSSKAPDKYYKPTGVKLSPISICVYGKDLGMTKRTINEYGFSIETIHEENVDSIKLMFNDGLEVDLYEMGCWGICASALDNDDCTIFCASFAEPIDTDNAAGIELDGVYYPLS